MRALVSFIALMTTLSGYAQTTSTSFFDAIKKYEDEHGISFSFDAELLKLPDPNLSFTTNNLDQFIREVESKFPLVVEQIDGTYYTIGAVETTYELMVRDSIDGTYIDRSFGVQVVVNDVPIPTSYSEGAWEFTYKLDANDKVSVFSQGYKSSVVSAEDLFNQKSLEVRLDLPTRRLNTVVVEDYLTKGINLMPSRQQIQIDVNDLPLLPGETDGDLFTSIAALPGITNPDSRAGNIFIRGSDTDQTLILFDNIPIYHRGHYYGTISPYNPKIVDDVEVYRSGFHPRFGDRVGGAIVINSDEAGKSSNYGLGANTLFGMGYGKIRISDKWSGALSIRKSYLRSFKSPKLEEISESVFAATSLVDQGGLLTDRVEVGFSDYNGKLSYQLNKNNRLGLSTIYTFSDINFRPVTPPDLLPRSNNNRYENIGANLSWEADWKSWSSQLSATYSKYDFEFTIKTLAPDVPPFVSYNSIDDLNVAHEFTRKSKYSNLQLGVDFKRQKVSTDYLNILSDSSLYSFAKTVEASTISPYTNYEFFGWSKWYVQLGMRGTYYSKLNDYSISPRLLLNYDLTDWMTLKSSHGWYNQFLSQVKNLEYSSGGFDNELWTLADNETGFIIRGTQSMFGAVINTNNKWIFDIEGFYKTANDITIYEDRRLNPNRGFYTMDQETYGVDVLLKKQVSEATSLWTGYSYHDSKIQIDTTDRVTYKSKYVQPHVWYLGGAYKKNRWKVSAAWRFASGLNAYSLDIAFAEAIFLRGPQNPPPPPPPGSPPPPRPPNPFEDVPERYPNVHSLDVSASYKIPQTDQRKWSATFGVSIINALNQANLTDRVYRSRDGFVDREAIGFAPNLMVILEW